jgi:type I restriction enzyme S subunit
MGGEWTECTVNDLKSSAPSALATGPFGSAIGSRFFTGSGIPVIRGSNLSQEVGIRLIDQGLVFIDKEKAKEFSRSVAQRGDLIFTCWGTIDQVGLIDGRSRYLKYVVSNKQMKFTPDPQKADSLFLYYLFSGPAMREAILAQGIGSSVPGFNLGQLRSISLRIPSLSEQRAIARVLGALDDKIELNRRMNETLEAIARALFKSWFVDFDPVRAKAEGRDSGLPASLANLFPASFDESELGDIPKGWQVRPFADTVDIIGGGTPRTSVAAYWNGDIPWFSVVDAPESSDVWVLDTEKKISCEGVESSSTRVLPVGTTIISARGTVGRIALVGVPMAMNQSCYGLRDRAGKRSSFTYFVTRELVARLQQHAHGSVFDTITRETLARVFVVMPPCALVRAFEMWAGPTLERMREVLFGSRTLAALRDTLLPKLISGEVRVKDVERVIREGA